MPDSFEGKTVVVIAVGLVLIAASLILHAFFMFVIIRSQVRLENGFLARARGISLLMPSILLATLFIAVSSFVEVVLWALVLWQCGPFDGFLEALYFSSTTYTTLGTAKHVLVPPYRSLEAMEAATGMLASGLNTAVLFAILASMGRRHSGFEGFFR